MKMSMRIAIMMISDQLIDWIRRNEIIKSDNNNKCSDNSILSMK